MELERRLVENEERLKIAENKLYESIDSKKSERIIKALRENVKKLHAREISLLQQFDELIKEKREVITTETGDDTIMRRDSTIHSLLKGSSAIMLPYSENSLDILSLSDSVNIDNITKKKKKKLENCESIKLDQTEVGINNDMQKEIIGHQRVKEFFIAILSNTSARNKLGSYLERVSKCGRVDFIDSVVSFKVDATLEKANEIISEFLSDCEEIIPMPLKQTILRDVAKGTVTSRIFDVAEEYVMEDVFRNHFLNFLGSEEYSELYQKFKVDHEYFSSLEGPLFGAIRHKERDKVLELLKNGTPVSEKNMTGQTVLHAAIEAEAHVLFNDILEWPGGTKLLDETDCFGITPIHSAARLGRTSFVEKLLSAGVDVNSTDEVGNTPLHAAAAKQHVEAAVALVKGGAKLDVSSLSGETPLDLSDLRLKVKLHNYRIDALIRESSLKDESLEMPEIYRLNHPEIDYDHERVLVYLRLIKLYLSEGIDPNSSVISYILTAIMNFFQYHCSNEEKIMVIHDFPRYRQHCREHRSFVSDLRDLITSSKNGEDNMATKIISVMNWLHKHILKDDRVLVEFIRIQVEGNRTRPTQTNVVV